MPSRRAVDMGAPAAVAALRTPPSAIFSYSDFGPDCDRFGNRKLELDHQNCVIRPRSPRGGARVPLLPHRCFNDITFPAISAKAPAKGWKVKRTTCRPRGQNTARKIA